MFSQRFQLPVQVTRHAQERMLERGINDDLLLELIETGTAKYKDATRLWLFKAIAGRTDNLLCIAAVLESKLVVKTVMHHFDTEA
ncbi:hypothetical protein AXE65_08820 [Ventosimonas gracilis]|uniref:DUF4258 domain-containing protein n=1 Tax=Ventosimonas gracilis TaxID=1680762 RepID=A0A139SXP7_9GAMM|nr:DUF4258 domain-containing protein [Ventosimonas gracilis]KXU39375.1 hypothetical protein AXE65_08820 [Ventosimonas gracilis]